MTFSPPNRAAAAPRFSALATVLRRDQPNRVGTPEEVVARAQRAERDGFDVICLADLGYAEIFPAVTLVALRTEQIAISTRVIGVFTRSPVLFASGAAWANRISGGRFSLGIGASLPAIVEGVHGGRWANPVGRMIDTLKLYRALYGEEVAGVRRNPDGSVAYEGETLRVERALLDLAAPRPPIIVAASAPRMLQVAGAWGDGAIIEYTSPGYIRWAWEQIAIGAQTTGRSLAAFDLCAETTFHTEVDDPALTARQESWLTALINHCLLPRFDHLWRPAGLLEAARAVRAAALRGDRAEARRLALAEIVPHIAVSGPRERAPAAFQHWLGERRALGVTTFALPLELEDFVGVTVPEARALATAG
ncbi:MAG: LLM class flavin-dependent oxidoreductase [Chloroflexota bacterium]|nr:LLM class flavin-dependent oxidoreductase [Dehalococcoidia bacterium]MDW8253812.1 LLM class flavin-dependent oxidoreductase [Chloroflexota bacterium]